MPLADPETLFIKDIRAPEGKLSVALLSKVIKSNFTQTKSEVT